MTITNTKRTSRTVGASVAAFALLGLTACGGETPQVPEIPTELPQVPGVGDPRQAFGDAHQKALGLAALGGVGVEQGVGDQVKELAPQVQGEGQQINDNLRNLASSIGVSLPDQVSPETQAQVDDLTARTGEEFDQGWLQAAQQEVGQLNEQAQGLLNVPGLPPEQIEQARGQLTNLGELKTQLDEAAAAAGAGTPGEGSGDAAAGGEGAGEGSGEGAGEGSGEGSGAGDGSGAGAGGQAAGPDAGAGGAGGSGAGGSDGAGSGAEGSGNGSGSGSGSGSGNGSGEGGAPAVDAGTGGQAASATDAVLPAALGGAGALLLGAGLIRLRRSRA